MPKLKQITCSIELGYSNVPLKEYNTRYTDGQVETYVAVPDVDTPFHVRLKSEGYIAPGFAAAVFIDGVPQCNRHIQGLRLPEKGVKPEEYEADFRLRQREDRDRNGRFVGHTWTFAKLNTERADKAAKAGSNLAKNVGTIEVIVLRCGLGGVDVPTPEPRTDSPSTLLDPNKTNPSSLLELLANESKKLRGSAKGPAGQLDGPSDDLSTLPPFGYGQNPTDLDPYEWNHADGEYERSESKSTKSTKCTTLGSSKTTILRRDDRTNPVYAQDTPYRRIYTLTDSARTESCSDRHYTEHFDADRGDTDQEDWCHDSAGRDQTDGPTPTRNHFGDAIQELHQYQAAHQKDKPTQIKKSERLVGPGLLSAGGVPGEFDFARRKFVSQPAVIQPAQQAKTAPPLQQQMKSDVHFQVQHNGQRVNHMPSDPAPQPRAAIPEHLHQVIFNLQQVYSGLESEYEKLSQSKAAAMAIEEKLKNPAEFDANLQAALVQEYGVHQLNISGLEGAIMFCKHKIFEFLSVVSELDHQFLTTYFSPLGQFVPDLAAIQIWKKTGKVPSMRRSTRDATQPRASRVENAFGWQEMGAGLVQPPVKAAGAVPSQRSQSTIHGGTVLANQIPVPDPAPDRTNKPVTAIWSKAARHESNPKHASQNSQNKSWDGVKPGSQAASNTKWSLAKPDNWNGQNEGWGSANNNPPNNQIDGWGNAETNVSKAQNKDWPNNELTDQNKVASVGQSTTNIPATLQLDPKVQSYWTAWDSPGGMNSESGKDGKKKARDPSNTPAYLPPDMQAPKPTGPSLGASDGKGTKKYSHRCTRPEYLDTASSPYAVFVFKYRSKATLSKRLNRDVYAETAYAEEQAVKERLGFLPKERLVAELYKARTPAKPASATQAGGNAGPNLNEAFGSILNFGKKPSLELTSPRNTRRGENCPNMDGNANKKSAAWKPQDIQPQGNAGNDGWGEHVQW